MSKTTRALASAIVTILASAVSAQPAANPAPQAPAPAPEKVPPISGPGPIWRLSINAKGLQARGHSRVPTLSDDGRYVAFFSDADNLIPGGAAEYGQFFLRDTTGGELRRLDPPAEGGSTMDLDAAVTGDGSAVIIAAVVVRTEDRHHTRDTVIYRYDIQARTFDPQCRLVPDPRPQTPAQTPVQMPPLASLRSARTATAIQIASDRLEDLRCSRDGRIIAFNVRLPAELRGGRPAPSEIGIALYDADTGEVSVPIQRVMSHNAQAHYLLSSDGNTIIYASDAAVGDEDTNSSADVFAYDIRSGKTERLSLSSEGIEGNSDSYQPVWTSPDGQRVIFRSRATNLAGDPDTARHDQDYLRDRTASRTSMLPNSYATTMSLRQDRAICFEHNEASLVIRDAAGKREHEIQIGMPSTQTSLAFSADGRWAVFSSSNPALVPNDTNNRDDVFLIDIDAVRTMTKDAQPAK